MVQRTPYKSFENVLLELDEQTRNGWYSLENIFNVYAGLFLLMWYKLGESCWVWS
jgi:hypothetical protein